jgi:hypothetical protein
MQKQHQLPPVRVGVLEIVLEFKEADLEPRRQVVLPAAGQLAGRDVGRNRETADQQRQCQYSEKRFHHFTPAAIRPFQGSHPNANLRAGGLNISHPKET